MTCLAQQVFNRGNRTRVAHPGSGVIGKALLAIAALGLAAQVRAEDITVKLVHGVGYEPFSFSVNDVPDGLLPRIADAVFSKCPGIRLEQAIYPWNRAQLMVEKGEANAVITVLTESRLSYLNPSASPVISPRFLAYASIKNPRIAELRRARQLDDFRKFRVGSYSGSGWARENLQGFDVDYTTSLGRQLFPMLELNRFDVAFENSIVADYVIRKESLQDNIKPLSAAVVGKYEWRLLLRKDMKGADAVQACFERQIKLLRKSPRWAAIWQSVGVDPASE